MEKMSDYGILGYGIDIIHNQPLEPVVNFTYEKKQVFEFQKMILIPDQFRFSPSPEHTMTEMRFSGVMETARSFQRSLGAEVGMGGTVDGVEFSGQASAANEMFEQTSSTKAQHYVSLAGEYVILGLDCRKLADAVRPEVAKAAEKALKGGDFKSFFTEYGTHFVKSGKIGGQIKVNTSLTLDAATAKTIASTKVSIGGQAKAEAGGYVTGKYSFGTRSTTEDKTYRAASTVNIALAGGKVASKDFDEWRESLNRSEIFSQADHGLQQAAHPTGPKAGKLYLALVGLQYAPLHSILVLNETDSAAFDAALKGYLGGANPFEDKVQRLSVTLPDSKAIKLGNKATFNMRGWMATYVTTAGLYAKPGAYAVVQCKDDASPGGWTEKTVYAGEVVTLRGKTPYLSAYMYIKFASLHGDGDDARVHGRNQLVSW